jgi:hypothetical protein
MIIRKLRVSHSTGWCRSHNGRCGYYNGLETCFQQPPESMNGTRVLPLDILKYIFFSIFYSSPNSSFLFLTSLF